MTNLFSEQRPRRLLCLTPQKNSRGFSTIGQDGDSYAKALAKAAGKSSVPTPMQAMAIEHARILKAFRDAEGRDPSPDGDPEFWSAYGAIQKFRTGRASSVADDPAAEWRRWEPDADGHYDATDLVAKSGDQPAWLREILARNGETADSLRKALKD